MRRSHPKQIQPNTQDVDGVYTSLGWRVTRNGGSVRRAAMAWQPREEVAAGTPASFAGCHGAWAGLDGASLVASKQARRRPAIVPTLGRDNSIAPPPPTGHQPTSLLSACCQRSFCVEHSAPSTNLSYPSSSCTPAALQCSCRLRTFRISLPRSLRRRRRFTALRSTPWSTSPPAYLATAHHIARTTSQSHPTNTPTTTWSIRRLQAALAKGRGEHKMTQKARTRNTFPSHAPNTTDLDLVATWR